QLKLKTQHLSLQVYLSQENTGDSYNVKPLADNLDLYTGGSAGVWGAKYKNALLAYASAHGGALSSANLVAATQYARSQADLGRAEPGTARFAALKDTIIHINNWDIRSASIPDAPVTGGAALVQKSNLYHAEAQWDFTGQIRFAKILAGADCRVYELIPDGNNFVDFSRPLSERNTALPDGSFGKHIYYKKFGGFVQVTKTFWEEALKLTGSLRFDDNPAFKATLTPRIALVYTMHDQQSFRLTYQEGYRYPALFEALSFVNNGRVRRVGILPVIDQGLGFRENSYTQASVADFNAAVRAAGNSDAAALANRNLLQPANLPEGKPESIRSLEAGYKTSWLHNRFSLDADAYLNVYKGFLGQIQVYVPIGETIGSDAAVIAMLDRNRDPTAAGGGNAASKGQDRYRVYTNAKNTYTSYGGTLGISYRVYKNFTASGNLSFNDMNELGTKDLFITGFNTPRWVSNISFGNRNLTKYLGFNIIWKWQDGFLWQSPLVSEASLPAFHTIDAQFTIRLSGQHCQLKIGGTNLLNNRHIEYAGGPTIGALYYTALTLDGLL
ncbi:MAG TPA: TonB-dependent receptor, partial [Sediminibacterium sp.]|nr:TonB-dependent receptor [Sediminibacterium sp.]